MILDFHTHSPDREDDVLKFYNTDLRKGESELLNGDYRCAGVHPWWIHHFKLKDKITIRDFLLNEKILCIGEIGLDRSFKESDFSTQVDFFNFQLEIAIERSDKFIVIHCVKAYQEILNSVRDVGFEGRLIFHDYNGSEEMTRKLVNRGDYFSYGNMLFHRNSKAMKSLSIIPINKLFIESDDQCRFSIQDAYNEASSFLKMSTEDLKVQCMRNFKHLLEL